MKTAIFIILFSVSAHIAQSQHLARHVVGSAGASAQNGQYSLCWTLGETAIITWSSPGTVIAEGFWQPGCGELVNNNDPIRDIFQYIRYYPNPTDGDLTIEHNADTDLLQVQILTVDGRIICRSQLTPAATTLFSLADQQPGAYFLRVFRADLPAVFQTFLLVKN